MSVIRLVAAVVICAVIATPASADVTLRLTLIETDLGRTIDVTEYRKGLKIRTDSSGGGIASVSMIQDAGTGRVVMLWHDGKGAEVHDLKQMPAGSGSVPQVQQSITPTVRSRQIAGSTCTVYDVKSSVEAGRMETVEPMTIVMEGSMCLVKNGPGHEDFARLYRAMANSAPASDPTLAIKRQMAELGVPFAMDLTMSVGGNGPTGQMIKIGTHTTEVSSVSAAPIPDSIFEIPAGYTVTTR
jgi:hypothetical protein